MTRFLKSLVVGAGLSAAALVVRSALRSWLGGRWGRLVPTALFWGGAPALMLWSVPRS